MKIDNKEILLNPHFNLWGTTLLTSVYHINMQIENKFAVNLQCFHVDNFLNNKFPQKQENLNNSNFMW